MKKVGLVTCEELPKLTEDDQFLLKDLGNYGINTEAVVWSSNIKWRNYDALLIRSVWDYHKQHREFITWLNYIKHLGIRMLNSNHLIQENIDKRYLKELEQKEISIVPTEILKENTIDEIDQKMDKHEWKSAVLKPTVSATAYHTHLIKSKVDLSKLVWNPNLTYMLQPFMDQIKQGEYSLIFFNGSFSHAILKKPKAGDFRVQSDFGGSFELMDINKSVIDQAQKVISIQKEIPLYARVDGIIIEEQFILMELELIEPELFLLNSELQTRFVRAILKRF